MKDNLFWQIVAGRLPMPNAAKLLGWRFLKHEPHTREVHVAFKASTRLTNPLGNIQGGMLTAMLDDCMGPAIYALLESHEIAVTLSMSTRFLYPASPGPITGTAKLYRRCGKYCYIRGELKDIQGRTLVTAKACFKIVPLPLPTPERCTS